MKNLEKCCKVLQKSRFRASEIYERFNLESNFGPNLMLSLLIRAQVGAKRGKLTSTWRLRGTKLELKEALEAPKEAPREPKGVRRPSAQRQGGCKGGTFLVGWPALSNLAS